MKTIVLLLCFAAATKLSAADSPTPSKFSARQGIPILEGERQREFIEAKRDRPGFVIGKSDIVVGGPLVAGLRKLPYQDGLSRAQRFLRLPIIRLFVPGPMDRPPGGTGKYFAWRNDDSALPWAAAASRPVGARGGADVRREPDSVLVELHK